MDDERKPITWQQLLMVLAAFLIAAAMICVAVSFSTSTSQEERPLLRTAAVPLFIVGTLVCIVAARSQFAKSGRERLEILANCGAFTVPPDPQNTKLVHLALELSELFFLDPQPLDGDIRQYTAGQLNSWLCIRLLRFDRTRYIPGAAVRVRKMLLTCIGPSVANASMCEDLNRYVSRSRQRQVWIELQHAIGRLPDLAVSWMAMQVAVWTAVIAALCTMGLIAAWLDNVAPIHTPSGAAGVGATRIGKILGWAVLAGLSFTIIWIICRVFGRWMARLPRECHTIAQLASHASSPDDARWTDAEVWQILRPLIAKHLRRDPVSVVPTLPLI